jgi:ATP-binding cassette subfamily C protein CydC
MGAALLGLSGRFITAAAAAGLAGVGTQFNVFAPSAMVRFLALGRTAARDGERLATHDAVLHALAALWLGPLRGLLVEPHRAVERLRAAAWCRRRGRRAPPSTHVKPGLSLRPALGRLGRCVWRP